MNVEEEKTHNWSRPWEMHEHVEGPTIVPEKVQLQIYEIHELIAHCTYNTRS